MKKINAFRQIMNSNIFFSHKIARLDEFAKNIKNSINLYPLSIGTDKQLFRCRIGRYCELLTCFLNRRNDIGQCFLAVKIHRTNAIVVYTEGGVVDKMIVFCGVAATRSFARDIGTQLGFGWAATAA